MTPQPAEEVILPATFYKQHALSHTLVDHIYTSEDLSKFCYVAMWSSVNEQLDRRA